MYQRAMDETLQGIDHPCVSMDDILIEGRHVAHHDSVLETVLHRAKSYNAAFVSRTSDSENNKLKRILKNKLLDNFVNTILVTVVNVFNVINFDCTAISNFSNLNNCS